MIKKLDAFEVLVIDDISYVPLERDETDVLFQLLSERYEMRSVVITSNLPFGKWGNIFKDEMTTAAAIDRLIHHAEILELNAESFRIQTAKTKRQKSLKEKNSDKEKISNLQKEIESNLHFHSGSTDYYWNTTDTNNFNNNTPIYDNKLKAEIDALTFKKDEFSRLKLKITLNYFRETIKGYSNQEHIGPLIGRMSRKFYMLEKLVEIKIDGDTKNLSVVSLRDVNIEMKKIIPLIVCKQLYERKKESDGKKSLHIIIDEAHNILSLMSQRESETWKDYRLETFEEIIKEGRKFGVFLTIASQRPYDISPTIISQLHNYFIHRLINDNDINAIEKAVAYLDKLSFETISFLPVGSCFVAGLASDIPVKVDIDLLEEKKQPKSGTVDLQQSWAAIT